MLRGQRTTHRHRARAVASAVAMIATAVTCLAAGARSSSADTTTPASTAPSQSSTQHVVTVPAECQSASAFADVAWQGPTCQAHGQTFVRLNNGKALSVAPPDTVKALAVTAGTTTTTTSSSAPASGGGWACVDPSTHTHVELFYAHFAGRADNYLNHVVDIQTMFAWVDEAYLSYSSQSYGGPLLHLYVECDSNGNPFVNDIGLSTTIGSSSFSTIVSDMQNQGHSSSLAHYWVWTDGNPTSGYAGQSSVVGDDSPGSSNAINSSSGYSINYGYAAGNGGSGIFAHENGHAMGAVQLSAPDTTGAWHCTDGVDVMCYNDGGPYAGGYTTGDCPTAPNGTSIMDCHRNNYFNPCPAPGSYLASHWNIASPNNAWIDFMAPGSATNFIYPPTAVVQGTPALLSVQVSNSGCGGGTVAFTYSGHTLGTAGVQANGIASVSLASLPLGTYSVSASFSGFGWAAGSTTPAPVTFSVVASPFKSLDVMNLFGGAVPVPPSLVGTQSNQWNWNISRGVAVTPNGTGGYVLDGWGGVHAFGTAPAVNVTGYWPGWDIAQGIVVRPDGQSGYVLDGWGGIHPFGASGDMPPSVSQTGYWPGWDIARGIVLRSDGASGYVLDAWGGVFPFGGAPRVSVTGYWPNWNIVRGIVLNPGTSNGYVLDGLGGLHPFGGAPNVAVSAYWPGWDIARAVVSVPGTPGQGWVLDGLGGLHPYGGAPSVGITSTGYWRSDIARGVAAA